MAGNDPRRLALLVNPTSGKGRHAAQAGAVAARLRDGGYDVTVMQGKDGAEAADLAQKAAQDGFAVLAVMGGDGLVHMAAQSLANSPTALGVIPTGTGNDVARYFDIPRGNPLTAADVIVGSRVRTIDLARAGSTYFVTVLAAGFDSLVNERVNRMAWPKGQMRYNLATLAELRVFNPLSYTLELDGVRLDCEAMLVAVGNGPSYGGGLRMCEGAELDDGFLDVVIIRPISKPQLIKFYPRLFKGTHVSLPQYEHHRVKQVSIAATGVVGYADGERIRPLPLTVDVAPSSLKVIVPG